MNRAAGSRSARSCAAAEWWSGAVLVLGAGLAGCVEPDPYRGPIVDYGDGIAELTIDSGASVEPDPGAGVGLSLEYAGAGRWWLYTSCDFLETDVACVFDVVVYADDSASGIRDIEESELAGSELEPDDEVYQPDDFALALDFLTDADLDGVGFATEPGATVRVSALLYDPVHDSGSDWSDDPRMISWVGSGALHWGAPTNPVDLTPDRP